MLTCCSAIANPMTLKLTNMLLKAVPLCLLSLQGAALAQVLPVTGQSAPVPTSIVPATTDTDVVQNLNQIDISGGQFSDGVAPNVIHQFSEFDVGTGDVANFVVEPSVANVVSLIDALQPSSIDGLLTLTSLDSNIASNANLVLVNPAGIVFGANASLNIPANLTATTASGLLFEDLYQLSVDGSVNEMAAADASGAIVKPAAVQNLAGDPTGYVLEESATTSAVFDPFSSDLPVGSIHNQGTLQVSSQSTLALIGQYVQNDGTLAAPGGTVNLVAVSGDNFLRFSQPGNVLALDLDAADDVTTFSTTELPQHLTGGEPRDANQMAFDADGSLLLVSTPNLTPAAGKILVRGMVTVSDSAAQGTINIVGEHINLIGGDILADGGSQAGTVSIGGMTADGSVDTVNVLVDRNSVMSASSDGSPGGAGGIIRIRAADTVRFYGNATAAGSVPEGDGTVLIEAGENLDIREVKTR